MTEQTPIEFPGLGGARDNAGRHYIGDKKKQTYLYIRQSVLDKLGGKEAVQAIMQKAIDQAYADKLLVDQISKDI